MLLQPDGHGKKTRIISLRRSNRVVCPLIPLQMNSSKEWLELGNVTFWDYNSPNPPNHDGWWFLGTAIQNVTFASVGNAEWWLEEYRWKLDRREESLIATLTDWLISHMGQGHFTLQPHCSPNWTGFNSAGSFPSFPEWFQWCFTYTNQSWSST